MPLSLLEGTYVIDPLWTKLFKKDLVTVHPLGGCVMADDASSGVVNHKGQVYAGVSGSETCRVFTYATGRRALMRTRRHDAVGTDGGFAILTNDTFISLFNQIPACSRESSSASPLSLWSSAVSSS